MQPPGNRTRPASDYHYMQCPRFREAISARLDGEPLGMPADELDQHLTRCADCTGWADDAALLTRRARLAASPAIPDLTVAVLSALPRDLPGTAAVVRGRLADVVLRVALVVTAAAQAALSWPALMAGTGAMSAPVHMAHESGAWNLAVAAGFVAVAAAPRLAAGALPFVGSLAVLLVPVTVADLAAGHVHADRAGAHLLLLAGTALVAVLAWRGARSRPAGAAGRRRVPA